MTANTEGIEISLTKAQAAVVNAVANELVRAISRLSEAVLPTYSLPKEALDEATVLGVVVSMRRSGNLRAVLKAAVAVEDGLHDVDVEHLVKSVLAG